METNRKGGGFIEMETTDGLENSVVFHVVKEIIGFILYMHHQIPSVLQHLECEFDNLKNELKELEEVVLPPAEQKASFQRKHNLKIREVKQGIKKLEKLMHAISTFLSALQVILDQIPDAEGVILVLGGSLIRPQHVYELTFSHSGIACRSEYGHNRDRVAEILSKKAIRALISSGAGGATYAGPMKLFLLVKAPVTFNLPMHFLPKRDFTYSKKITPLKLLFRSRVGQDMDDATCNHQTDSSTGRSHSTSDDMIWFQCRHTIKGLPSKTPVEEC